MYINERIRERMYQFIAEEAARWQLDNIRQEYMAMSTLSGSVYSADWQGQWELTYLGPDNEEALAKSRKLLMSFLGSKQLAEFEKHTRITVKAAKNVYRIYPQKQFNVQQRQPNGKWLRLCAIPNKSLPIYDTMLAQMLVLQTNEDAFLRVANTERDWMTTMLNWEAFACSYGR